MPGGKGVGNLFVATELTRPDQPRSSGGPRRQRERTWLLTTPRRPLDLGGTGDAFSALFLGHYLATADLRLALERAVAAVFALMEATHAAGADELQLVAAQDELVAPTKRPRARRLR